MFKFFLALRIRQPCVVFSENSNWYYAFCECLFMQCEHNNNSIFECIYISAYTIVHTYQKIFSNTLPLCCFCAHSLPSTFVCVCCNSQCCIYVDLRTVYFATARTCYFPFQQRKCAKKTYSAKHFNATLCLCAPCNRNCNELWTVKWAGNFASIYVPHIHTLLHTCNCAPPFLLFLYGHYNILIYVSSLLGRHSWKCKYYGPTFVQPPAHTSPERSSCRLPHFINVLVK